MTTKYLLNELKSNHTKLSGEICIDDSAKTLMLTAECIKDDAETDFDCMKSQILELNEIEVLADAFASQDVAKVMEIAALIIEKSESILKETIERLLRAA